MISCTFSIQPERRQQGVALIMAMVFLMILTIIGVTVMSTTSLQEKMAGNVQDKHSAFQAAESALRDAEAIVEAWTSKPGNFATNSGGYYMSQPANQPPWWETVDWVAGSGALAISGTVAGVKAQPTYILEDLGELAGSGGGAGSIVAGFAPPAATAGGATMYRITARGVGRSANAIAIVQSVYRK